MSEDRPSRNLIINDDRDFIISSESAGNGEDLNYL